MSEPRELPTGASTKPISRRRNVELVGWPLGVAAFLGLLVATNRVITPGVVAIAAAVAIGSVLVTIRDLRKLTHSAAALVEESPVEVVDTNRAGLGGAIRGEPEVELADLPTLPGETGEGVETAEVAEGAEEEPEPEVRRYRVIADRKELRSVPVESQGTRYEYEDGVSIVVLDDRTLWCRPAKR